MQIYLLMIATYFPVCSDHVSRSGCMNRRTWG